MQDLLPFDYQFPKEVALSLHEPNVFFKDRPLVSLNIEFKNINYVSKYS